VKSGTESERTLRGPKSGTASNADYGPQKRLRSRNRGQGCERRLQAITLQLEQHGLSPELLHSASPELDVVLAEVPEGKLSRITVGQNCVAHFYVFPMSCFPGRSNRSCLSCRPRSGPCASCWSFKIPKTFSVRGCLPKSALGSIPAAPIRVSADAVVHYGPDDYVIQVVDSSNGPLRLRPEKVSVSELVRGNVEVTSGLKTGEHIVTANAILLKPLLVQSIVTPTTQVAAEPGGGSDSR